MERKRDGKQFEENCKECPYLLAFNRQVKGEHDEVTVDCRLAKCRLEPEEAKPEAKGKGK